MFSDSSVKSCNGFLLVVVPLRSELAFSIFVFSAFTSSCVALSLANNFLASSIALSRTAFFSGLAL